MDLAVPQADPQLTSMRQRTAASCRPERRSRTDTLRVTAVGLVIRGRVGRLAEARDLIERQDRWRTALVTALAHDVCTPLIAITGALELVAEHDGLSDQLKPLVTAAESAGFAARDAVGDPARC
jgi:K+-sensing histidine kinase KdpD